MAAEPLIVERLLTAFMEDPDGNRNANVIHSSAGAREAGFKAALIGGPTLYGWTVPAVREALGDSWLDHGWADVSFRRPVYPGDALRVRLEQQAPGRFSLALTDAASDAADGAATTFVSGEVALGDAPWRSELHRSQRRAPEPSPDPLLPLTPDTVPLGRDLPAMAVPVSVEDAARFAVEEQADRDPIWSAASATLRPRLHPGWLALRATRLVRHTYTYGASIQTRVQMQHLGRAEAGQTITVAGRFVDAYERKGHQYGVADCLVLDEQGREVALLRYTVIYQVAVRDKPR